MATPSYKKALFSSSMAALGTAEIMAGWQHLDKSVLAAPLIVGGFVSILWATSPVIRFPHRKKAPAMELLKDFTQFQIKEAKEGGYIARFKERPGDEYIFSHRSLPCPVSSSTLIDFIKIGHRRERNALTGQLDFDIKGRLQIHQAWSKGYFTKQRRLNFSSDQYESCLAIMVFCRQHYGRRSGTPGNLINPYQTAGQIYERVEVRWRYFFDRPPAPSPTILSRLIKKSGVLTPLYRLAQA